MPTATYPFDPVGTNPLCRIDNEQHVLTSLNNTQLYQTIIPEAAPFFTEGVSLIFHYPDTSTRVLVEGVDYYFTHLFISASKATAKPVAGSITFLDKDIQGVVRIGYQTIGGIWTLNEQEIVEILANLNKNPRTTAWEQITDLPTTFPVIDHEWDLADMVGASEIVEGIFAIRDAILLNSDGGIASHVGNKDNPHEVTKAQVGLGSVQNYPVATQEAAEGGSNNTSYMTPLRVYQAISALGDSNLNEHIADNNNPHGTTKAQVGLGNVGNYSMATDGEAIAGVSTALYMSPASTKAVADVINAALAAHANDQLNPHNTTKDQLSLFNVENYAVATAQEAQTGTANNKYMTPLRTAQAIAALASGELGSHVSDFTNPHNTTKAQVGLGSVENYAIAGQSDAEAGVSNDFYMTPLRTAQAITAQIGEQFVDHLNASNPHSVTKAQVGLGNVQNYAIAVQSEAEQGLSNAVYMTPIRVAQAITSQLGNDFSAHLIADNPHNTTAEQIGAYTKAETDALLVAKLNANDTAVNSALLESFTKDQIVAESVTNALTQVGVSFAAQVEVPRTEHNESYGDYVFVKLGQLSVGIDTGDGPGEQNNLHWALCGGGYSTEEPGFVSQLHAYELAISAHDNAGILDLKYQMVYKTMPYPSTDAGFVRLFFVKNDAEKIVTIYARLLNGHASMTITDLNPFGFSQIDPQELSDIEPNGATEMTCIYFHKLDPDNADKTYVDDKVSDLNQAIQGSLTSVNESIDATNTTVGGINTRLSAAEEDIETFALHVGNTNNPHNTTKDQVGLGNVENYLVASDVEAEAGLANDRYMTPLRVAQAIDALAADAASSEYNRIVNGGMEFSQEFAETPVLNPVSQKYILDGWQVEYTGLDGVTAKQSTNVPAGGKTSRSLEVEITTAKAVLDTADYFVIQQNIEGVFARDFVGEPLFLIFDVISPKAGKHSVTLRNGARNRSCLLEYTVDQANEWESKAILLEDGIDPTGFTFNNGTGLRLGWTLAAGSDTFGTAEEWSASNYKGVSDQVNCFESTGFFRITGVDLRKTDKPFAYKNNRWDDELRRCQRYYAKTFDLDKAPGIDLSNGSVTSIAITTGSATALASWEFPVEMRAQPTITTYNATTGATGNWRDGAGGDTPTTVSLWSRRAAYITNNGSLGTAVLFTGHIVADARLS